MVMPVGYRGGISVNARLWPNRLKPLKYKVELTVIPATQEQKTQKGNLSTASKANRRLRLE